MRVVVVHPARTEEDGTEVPESASAYRLGRIEDLTDPLTGETTPAAKVAEILTEKATAEFPGQTIRTEYMHVLTRDGNGQVETSEWLDHPPEDVAAPPGQVQAAELEATQTQEVGQ